MAAKTPSSIMAIALDDLVALVARQRLHFVDVAADGFGEVVEVERQQLGAGQAHHGGAGGLRQRACRRRSRVSEKCVYQ